MSELNITAGQLSGMVYVKFEPPLSDNQLLIIKDSDVLSGAEHGETNYGNRITRFRPDWADLSETLGLEGKDMVLKMGELLASQDVSVVTEEALLDGRDWYFDEPVETTPITREVVDRELQHKRLNEKSALRFVGMLGGWGAALANGAHYTAARILEAGLDDDLSGLRKIAEMSFSLRFGDERHDETTPDLSIVSPAAARHWLLKQKRAKELPTGELRIIGKNTDHMTQAGLWIAQQENSTSFVSAYRSMNPESPLTDDVILDAGASITVLYLEDSK